MATSNAGANVTIVIPQTTVDDIKKAVLLLTVILVIVILLLILQIVNSLLNFISGNHKKGHAQKEHQESGASTRSRRKKKTHGSRSSKRSTKTSRRSSVETTNSKERSSKSWKPAPEKLPVQPQKAKSVGEKGDSIKTVSKCPLTVVDNKQINNFNGEVSVSPGAIQNVPLQTSDSSARNCTRQSPASLSTNTTQTTRGPSTASQPSPQTLDILEAYKFLDNEMAKTPSAIEGTNLLSSNTSTTKPPTSTVAVSFSAPSTPSTLSTPAPSVSTCLPVTSPIFITAKSPKATSRDNRSQEKDKVRK